MERTQDKCGRRVSRLHAFQYFGPGTIEAKEEQAEVGIAYELAVFGLRFSAKESYWARISQRRGGLREGEKLIKQPKARSQSRCSEINGQLHRWQLLQVLHKFRFSQPYPSKDTIPAGMVLELAVTGSHSLVYKANKQIVEHLLQARVPAHGPDFSFGMVPSAAGGRPHPPDPNLDPIAIYSRALQAYTLRLWTESLRAVEERRAQKENSKLVHQAGRRTQKEMSKVAHQADLALKKQKKVKRGSATTTS
ncbi:hypothetical protein C8F04DRAFT_1228102 [Mycena alexandri]|uniref:Uncharacterized protein n=1 Tax=Mycena alexandri TaxID=1745969 RepID=A0AAD6TEF8_9AGAR|nr:hypothetical protein C8F04DRAFT_1228102 [Mycena alexandri]